MAGPWDAIEFEAQARPHLDALYRTALRMVRHPATAEDLVQEACLRAFAAARHDPHKTSFRAWLFRILVNLCIDHLRASGRQPLLLLSAVPFAAEVVADGRDPEQLAIEHRLRGDLRTAVETLPPELRIVVLLVLVEGLSYAEAAHSLEVPVGTVRSRLNRARGRLQTLLRGQAPQGARPLRPPAHLKVIPT
jgi:RNA polymerase sigma-70 factor, ECF subfamily